MHENYNYNKIIIKNITKKYFVTKNITTSTKAALLTLLTE